MARPFFTMGFLLACACGTSTGGSDAGLRWYFTCGDPTCGGYRARDGGPPPCTSQAEGSACDGGGQSCDPKDFCNRLLVCTDRDPAGGPGCPVSRARHKRDIAYLGGDELRAYAKELEALPLATWRYNGEPVSAPRRLGFLIDDDEDGCPFCPGNEPMTPPELLVRRAQGSQPNRPGWTLRVVPNRFPALRTEERMTRSATGLYDSMAGVGAHEVIIETAEHGRALPQQTAAEVQELLRAAQERMLDLSRDVRLRSALFFKNSGWAAGSTLSHPHSQLLALPVVPLELQEELSGARGHFDEKERCIFCDVVAQEARERPRVVLETDGFIAFMHWAARSPFDVWVLPCEHRLNCDQESRA